MVVFDSNGEACWTVVGLALEATVPGCDCVSPSFNIIKVAAVVGQFLLAPFRGGDWTSTGWSSMVGSPIDNFSIGIGNS